MDMNDNEYEDYDFGWWPEIVGIIGLCLLLYYLIAHSRGTF